MAVIDRWLAAIDHLYTSNRHEFPRWSDGGHELGPLAIGKRQSLIRQARYSAIATAGRRTSRAVNRDTLSSR
jgi:hypothetical protein